MRKKAIQNPISLLIERLKLSVVASKCGVTHQAVRKWEKSGLPRSEWTGETQHAKRLAELSDGDLTVDDLLGWSRQVRLSRAA